jgi:hypothetical protein
MRSQPATREPVDALAEMLDGFLAVRRTTAFVSFEDDPNIIGRRAYRITGETREAVQLAIDARMRVVEDSTGYGNFIGPYRYRGLFLAIGETIIKPVTA